MADTVSVTQADIDAAENWRFIECRHCSEYDGDFVNDLAEDFAHHRLTYTQSDLRDALSQIKDQLDDDNFPPDGGVSVAARIKWIENELEDEPNRLPYGSNDRPPCRNGHEIAELLIEYGGLIARAALKEKTND